MSQDKFEHVGEVPGLLVWRVEKMNLVLQPEEQQGNFFMGDCYLVLMTTECGHYKCHSWIGKEATADERGCVAMFLIELDEWLGGAAVQFNEFQNEESLDFVSYFPDGLKYMKGGVHSGFSHTETNVTNRKRLLHVKGRRNIRATEVDLHWSSFNNGDYFIIELKENIFVWAGCKSNRFEGFKANEVAKCIRDNECGGRSEVTFAEEGKEPEAVLDALGPKPEQLPDAMCDQAADVTKKTQTALYLVSDATGSMKTTLVADKNPFNQSMLSHSDCYILDDGKNRKLYIWKGRSSNVSERKDAWNIAKSFIKDKNYSEHTKVVIIPAGAEPITFLGFFPDWAEECTGEVYTMGSIAKVEKIPFDASKLHDDSRMAAQYGMVDDGSGKLEIWRVEGKDKVAVDQSTHGQFFGGDCYLLLYSYNEGSKTKHIIYIWQGQKCDKVELGASAVLAVKLDDSMGGVATQVRVPQGQEPAHLVSLFKDKPLIINRGGTSREGGQSKAGNKRLFHIRQSNTKATRAVEVEPSACYLNSNDVFVLKTPKNTYIWKGKGSHEEEMGAAEYVAKLLEGTVTTLEETKEPSEFWDALGGKKKYSTSKALQNMIKPPRLFGCSNKTGNLIAEEVPGDFTQKDLAPDDVMILDIWNEIFVWIGKDANDAEKAGVSKIAQDYLKSDPSCRFSVPIITIKQGEEPKTFTGWFQGWE